MDLIRWVYVSVGTKHNKTYFKNGNTVWYKSVNVTLSKVNKPNKYLHTTEVAGKGQAVRYCVPPDPQGGFDFSYLASSSAG